MKKPDPKNKPPKRPEYINGRKVEYVKPMGSSFSNETVKVQKPNKQRVG